MLLGCRIFFAEDFYIRFLPKLAAGSPSNMLVQTIMLEMVWTIKMVQMMTTMMNMSRKCMMISINLPSDKDTDDATQI
jgi:hypothetical protein